MKIIGITFIVIGLIGIIFEKHPSELEKEIESKLEAVRKLKSVRVLLIDNRKVNIGLVVLGIVFVLID